MYKRQPLGLRRINIAKYGNYIIIMNCSDEDKAVNVELEADVSKIHDLVTDTMMDVNNSIKMCIRDRNYCYTVQWYI